MSKPDIKFEIGQEVWVIETDSKGYGISFVIKKISAIQIRDSNFDVLYEVGGINSREWFKEYVIFENKEALEDHLKHLIRTTEEKHLRAAKGQL